MKTPEELADGYTYDELFYSWKGNYQLSKVDQPSQELKFEAMEIKRNLCAKAGFPKLCSNHNVP